jgi:hypothetical protein
MHNKITIAAVFKPVLYLLIFSKEPWTGGCSSCAPGHHLCGQHQRPQQGRPGKLHVKNFHRRLFKNH